MTHHKPLFSKKFLAERLAEFELSNVVNIASL
jgi:hypothetical protein